VFGVTFGLDKGSIDRVESLNHAIVAVVYGVQKATATIQSQRFNRARCKSSDKKSYLKSQVRDRSVDLKIDSVEQVREVLHIYIYLEVADLKVRSMPITRAT